MDGDPDRFFTFRSDDDGKIAGTVEGEEKQGVESADLNGSWAEGRLTILVYWPSGTVTYRADFTEDNPTQLVLKSDQETLIIE